MSDYSALRQAAEASYRQQEAEIKRLEQWVNDLQAGMYINCVYCGHRYGPDSKVPATMAEVLKQHIEQCPKHPMSALKTERDQLAAQNRELAAQNRELEAQVEAMRRALKPFAEWADLCTNALDSTVLGVLTGYGALFVECQTPKVRDLRQARAVLSSAPALSDRQLVPCDKCSGSGFSLNGSACDCTGGYVEYETDPSACAECGHSLATHGAQGCETERGDGRVGSSDVLQALGPCGCHVTDASAPASSDTEPVRCAPHNWQEKSESDSGGNRSEVVCKRCGMVGERDNNTGIVYYPAT